MPGLAAGWTVVDGRTWRFHLRRGVRFHDGTPLTADDVVFSIERAQQPSSQQALFARKLGKPVRVDAETFELHLPAPNPLLLETQLNVVVMSRVWCKAHGVERVPDSLPIPLRVLLAAEPALCRAPCRPPTAWRCACASGRAPARAARC